MLVITRNIEEGVVFQPSGIEIVIVGVDAKSGRVRLGINAPKSEEIVRRELLANWTGRHNKPKEAKR